MRLAPLLLALAGIPTVLAGEAAAQLKLLGPLPGARPLERSNVTFSPDGKLLASSNTVGNTTVFPDFPRATKSMWSTAGSFASRSDGRWPGSPA
jgi:hypothetical protein